MAPRTVVVVPCYDEAARLPTSSYAEFLRAHADVGFVFVDDGSRDGTLALLRGIASAAPERARVLALPGNVGKAEAVRLGMLSALEDGAGAVGFWDADLSTPLDAILEFREILERRPQIDLAIGSRVVLLGRRVERRALRHYLGRIAATAISLALGLRVYDTQCGAKLFRAGEPTRALFAEPFTARWIFDVEILARMVRARRGGELAPAASAICEVPLARWLDVAGSKVRARDYLRGALDLWRIRRRYLA